MSVPSFSSWSSTVINNAMSTIRTEIAVTVHATTLVHVTTMLMKPFLSSSQKDTK